MEEKEREGKGKEGKESEGKKRGKNGNISESYERHEKRGERVSSDERTWEEKRRKKDRRKVERKGKGRKRVRSSVSSTPPSSPDSNHHEVPRMCWEAPCDLRHECGSQSS